MPLHQRVPKFSQLNIDSELYCLKNIKKIYLVRIKSHFEPQKHGGAWLIFFLNTLDFEKPLASSEKTT